MGIQSLTTNFIKTISVRVRDFAAIELFNGNYEETKGRLALDFTVPVVEDEVEYELVLVAHLKRTDLDTDLVIDTPVFIRSKYAITQVKVGPANWTVNADAIAYPLVSALKTVVQGLVQPRFLFIYEGDYFRADPDKKRLWV